jgi:hypothetical protein
MATARDSHTATLFPNGLVLVTGGYSGSGAITATAELYDPVANAWSSTASMSTEREGHSATLLPNGTVLAAGGFNNNGGLIGGFLTTAEIYHP